MSNREIGQLIQRIRMSDGDAIAYFVRQYQPLCYRVAYRLTHGNTHDAMDLCQEALMILIYGKSEQGQPNTCVGTRLAKWKPTGRFHAWLNRTFGRLCIDILRSQRQRFDTMAMETLSDVPNNRDHSPEDEMLRQERNKAIQDCMSLLTPQERQAIEMKYIDGCPLMEVAQTLATPITTLRSWLYRARDKLRECLSRKYGEILR